jgi:uncharacterized membrane protein YhaH (DUF805 family)
MNYLFSFQGRINRAKLWLFLLITIGAGFVYGILFVTLVGFSVFTAHGNNGNGLLAAGGSLLFMLLIGVVLEIALFVASLALNTKRLHDRNKGAVWLIPFIIIPTVLSLYATATVFSQSHFDPQLMAQAGANPAIIACRLISTVLWIWGFVELYCLRGTLGDNRFGPDPLNPLMSVERTF